MGSCQSDSVVEIDDNSRSISRSLINNSNMYNEQDPNFPDMKEWPGERYKGIGIKRMKGYICDLPIDKLNKKREIFWLTKCRQNLKWQIVQQACVYDEYRSNVVLEKYRMRTANGCINHIIDESGNHYHVPNYCINDPYFEKELLNDSSNDNTLIKLFLYEASQNITLQFQVNNNITGSELKEYFRKGAKIKKKKFNLRLFFSGSEIKDEHYLYQHKLENDFKIQVMKVPINNNNE